MEEKTKCKCPACKGTGEIEAAISYTETNRPIAKRLVKEGHSMREVAKLLGYKNPGSITNLLNGPKKKVKK